MNFNYGYCLICRILELLKSKMSKLVGGKDPFDDPFFTDRHVGSRKEITFEELDNDGQDSVPNREVSVSKTPAHKSHGFRQFSEHQHAAANFSPPAPWVVCTARVRVASAKPYKRSPPSWLKISSQDVEENICKFARKGLTPSQIGVILRDSLGIAHVNSFTGSKILRILKAHGLAPEIPEDLIHRLARYYKKTKKLPPVWKYESTTASGRKRQMLVDGTFGVHSSVFIISTPQVPFPNLDQRQKLLLLYPLKKVRSN
ncbi:hypothetical protein L1987_58900 [Smallanthus sonchifolius]|uniref:Uncharacterized protein n=1 Tax=Smallanthus sonchifolius TaxID=185202 RepID=A0ACB9D463_9ASTR|nr:hypothetical protein L1987_58900 [Smallanthus sonchifolius]